MIWSRATTYLNSETRQHFSLKNDIIRTDPLLIAIRIENVLPSPDFDFHSVSIHRESKELKALSLTQKKERKKHTTKTNSDLGFSKNKK